MVTPERAEQIAKEIWDSGDWGSKSITLEERKYINEVWETMPDNTCFYDACVKIAIQNFGDFLGFSPHTHVLISDGCFYNDGKFKLPQSSI